MKHLGKIVALGAVFAVSVSSAFAATIQLGSFAGGANSGVYPLNPGNPGVTNTALLYTGFTAATTFTPPGPGGTAPVTAPTSNIPVGTAQTTYYLAPQTPTWDAPLALSDWVGIAQTAGPQGTGISQANDPSQGFYTFTTTFGAAAGVYNLSLSVEADDTVEVFLNNIATPIIGFGNLGGDSHCADSAPTCHDMIDTINLSETLTGATNTLYFVVEQGGNLGAVDPSGVDFDATLSQAPEPNSLILLGTGLFGAAGMLIRKRQTA